MSDNTLYPNTFQCPNVYVDKLMYLLTAEENVVLVYLYREILGWEKHRGTRRSRVSLSQFTGGYFDKEGNRIAYGTGLARSTIISCLNNLCGFRIIIKYESNSDGTEYGLNWEGNEIDIASLRLRQSEKQEMNKKRMAAAIAASPHTGLVCETHTT